MIILVYYRTWERYFIDRIDLTKIVIAKELKKNSASMSRKPTPSVTEEAYFSKKNKELVDKLKKKKA